MATIANAMKGVVLSSTSKTQGGSGSAALNDTDLVQLYDNAGNPNGKITKSALMDAVKASLPAILSDQTTTGVNFPSINGSGVLGKMTAANLASVLGGKGLMPVKNLDFTGDANSITEYGWYRIGNGSTNTNGTGVGSWLLSLPHSNAINYATQHLFSRGIGTEHSKIFSREKAAGTWSDWIEYSFNIPTFYKNYQTLEALEAAFGETRAAVATVDSSNPLRVATVGNGHSALITLQGVSWNYACLAQRQQSGTAATLTVIAGSLPSGLSIAWSSQNDYFVLNCTTSYSIRYSVLVL